MTTLSKNVVFNLVGQGLVLALSFIAAKFIFKQLGADLFGITYFSITLAAILTTALELGISATTVREVSRHFDSEPSYITALVQTASLLYWGFGLLIFIVIFVTAPVLVEKWINLRTTDVGTAVLVLRILSVGTMVALPRTLYTSLFRGRQRMALNNVIDVITAIVQQLGIVVLLRLGASVITVVGWVSTSVLLSIAVYIAVAGHLFSWRALTPGFDAGVVGRNFRFTTLMTSNSLLALLLTQADKIFVSKLLSVAQFGLYGFASATVSRANFVTSAIGQAAFPSFASLFQAGDHPALMRQYGKLQDLVCYGTLPIFASICFAARPAYTYLFNASAAGQLLVPTALLALSFYMSATVNTPYMLSLAVGKPQIIVKANSVALFIVLPVTGLLIVTLGITGAALSCVFYQLFAYAFIAPRISRQCLDIRPLRWYLHVLKAFSLGFAAYGLSWQLIASAGSFSVAVLTLAFLAGSAAFGAGAYFLIGPDLRDTLLRLPCALTVRKARAL